MEIMLAIAKAIADLDTKVALVVIIVAY